MFRFPTRGPRTVRVPIDRSGVEVQQVKVTRQSRPIVARFILTCIVTTLLIQGIKRWDPLGTYAQRDVLQEELERVKKESQRDTDSKYGKHWDKQHANIGLAQAGKIPIDATRADAIRITVPIWLRKGHRRIYHQLDPEWKEFVKLQSDPKRIDQIKRQIGESVMHQVKETGRAQFELAVIRFNGRVGVALEIVPQIFTPPIYEVPCLWLSTKSISAGWRPLPASTGARIERIFRPVVLLEASTAAVKVFFHVTYAVTKAKLLEALGKGSSDGQKSMIVLPKIPGTQDANVPSLNEAPKSTKPYFPFFPDLGNSDAMRKMHADVVSSMPYSSAIQHAAFAFNHVRKNRQRLAVSTNVRGICQVRGFITFFGDRGRFRLEVIAYYLPADNVFVGAVNVKSGYVVQDYRAWEKMIMDKERLEKEAKVLAEEKTVESAPAKPSEPSSVPSSEEDRERDK